MESGKERGAMMTNETWIDREERAYTSKWGRKARVILRQNAHNPIDLPYGQTRTVRAGIADTYLSAPAKLSHKPYDVRGYVSSDDDGVLYFTPDADCARCVACLPGEGCKRVECARRVSTTASGRTNVKGILADKDQKRELMISTIMATQAREGIETTREQAAAAYDKIQAQGKDEGGVK
jgi:hypothetical protein